MIDTPETRSSLPVISSGNGFCRGPKTASTTLWMMVAIANVEMKAVISKSTPARPSSGRTAA